MIKQKKGKCIDCPPGAGEVPLIAKRCQFHYWSHRSNVNAERVTERLKNGGKSAVLSNRNVKQLEYAKKRKAWIQLHSKCEAQIDRCQGQATQVHHMQGRAGELLTDESKWLAVCHNCHTWITEHSAQAVELGLSLKRNT